MELLDREFMRQLLEQLAGEYPQEVPPEMLGFDPADQRLVRHLAYLAEHQLVDVKLIKFLGAPPQAGLVTITAAGLDFLQDDGGLGAILKVVTVRLDAETIKGLIEERIEADQAMPAEEKSMLMEWLKSAGKEALSEATKRLLAAALDQAPSALQLLQMLRG